MELRPARFSEDYLEINKSDELVAIQFAAEDRANAISKFDLRHRGRRRDLIALALRMAAARRRTGKSDGSSIIIEAPDAELALDALRWDVNKNPRLSNEGVDFMIRAAFESLDAPTQAA